MLLQPNKSWQWYFDPTIQRMTLLLSDEMQFVSELEGRKMSPAAQRAEQFTCEQTHRYNRILESLAGYDWPDPIKVQMALNALTFADYHKPMMPQSWFFEQGREMQPCEFGEIIYLQAPQQLGRFIVLDVQPTTALCMSIDSEITLSATKTLCRFGVIKVMKDRIMEQPELKMFARAV